MPGKQAKLLNDTDIRRVLDHITTRSRQRERDTVLFLLSLKAGLRAGEIARLSWPMVLDAQGQLSTTITLIDAAAKYGSGRTIPIHPDLKLALDRLAAITVPAAATLTGAVIKSERPLDTEDRAERDGRTGTLDGMAPASIVNWFAKLYRSLGLVGCSSHSGRRTFLTRAARLVHKTGGSLRDVQILAGHRSIAMTERYIDGDSEAQRRLVELL